MARKKKDEPKVLGPLTEKEANAAWVRWIDRHVTLKAITHSPIEQRFAHALATIWEEEIGGPIHYQFDLKTPPDSFVRLPLGMTIICQCGIGPYRVDFLVIVNAGKGLGSELIIECDGHEFHEKTKEQARRDKRRDRELMLAGIRVIRFTGSEIHRDVFGCAREAMDHLASVHIQH